MNCPSCEAVVTVLSDSGEGTSFYSPIEGRAKKGEPACGMCGAPTKPKGDR